MASVDQPEGTTGNRPLLVVAILGFSSLSVSLMQSLVIPIQTDLPVLLHTTAANASWVVTATLLGGAVAMPIAGRLADIHGKRPVLVASAGILLAGSLLCAATTGVGPMLIGRAMQGLAMGYVPVAIAMVREVTPPKMTNSALAAVSATLGVGGALGLPLAAWIVEAMDWRALFWISALLAAVMGVLSAVALPRHSERHPARLDRVGAMALTAGLIGLLVGLTKGNDWGWTATSTIALILGGVVVLVGWGRYELATREPLVDLRVSSHLPVLFTNLAALMVGFAMMAEAIVVPQLLQIPTATGFGMGQSILATGLWMAPGGLMMLAFSPVSSVLLTRVGGRATLAIAGVVIATGYVLAVFLMQAPWQIMVATCVISAGVGIGYAAMPTLILDNVPTAVASAGVGLNSLMRSLGTTVAGAVMAIVLTSGATQVVGGPLVPGQGIFRLCFVLGALASLLAAGLTLLIPRPVYLAGGVPGAEVSASDRVEVRSAPGS